MVTHPHQLSTIWLADEPDSWRLGGFTVDGSCTTIGSTVVQLGDSSAPGSGIAALSIDDLDLDTLDGIELRPGSDPPDLDRAAQHQNHVTHMDHLVVMTPDCDRTTGVLAGAGIEARRVRRFETKDGAKRQTFFWLGDVILELVGPDDASGDDPATAWGLALTSSDLEAASTALEDRLGDVTDAVQRGRQIATLRTRDIGISTAIAFLSEHS